MLVLFLKLSKNVNETLNKDNWVMAMHEKLNQFTRNDVWSLGPKPNDHPILGTK